MSPRCLRADARRIVLNDVAKLIAFEHRKEFESTEEERTPEILEACHLIRQRWDEHEWSLRWMVAHSIGNISDNADLRRISQSRGYLKAKGLLKGGAVATAPGVPVGEVDTAGKFARGKPC